MIRTQIQLTDRQARELKRRAASRGVSIALLIREAVDQALGIDDEVTRRDRMLQAVGGLSSGAADVSERHDDYLAEAVKDWG